MLNTTLRRPEEELAATYGNTMVAREVALEERMVALGRDQIRKQIARAKEKGNEAMTSYGQNLIARSVEKLGGAVRAFIAKAETGGAGRRHIAVKYLKQIDPEVAAFIAMRCVVDGLTGKKQALARIAIVIGSRIEDEVRFAAWETEAKEKEDTDERKRAKRMFDRAADKAKKGTMYHRKRNTMAGYERRFSESEWTAWPEQDKLHIGTLMVDMICDTGYVEVGEEVRSRTKTVKVIVPSARLVDHIEREVSRSELLSPAAMPMIVKPLDWTTPFDGGYLTTDAQGRNAMVKTGNANYLMEIADHADEMPLIYDSLNALQATRWKINRDVYDALTELWAAGHEDAGLPSREDVGAVPCPCCGAAVTIAATNTRHTEEHACFEDPETLRQWKKDAYVTHARNVSLRSKRLAVAKTLRVADTFVDEDAIHFPYQLDFRGRIYCIPSFNPQGDDVTKSLLHFADGLPIEDGVAAGWLAIHGANVWGFDKENLEDRIEWVEDRADLIQAIAADPLENRQWVDADKPFQFLAFCFEWAGFLREGYGFVSHLAVAMDGSCSGIQHFSAMLLDKVGGDAVNLVPSVKPQDIYQKVCDRVIAKLENIASELSSPIAKGTAESSSPSPSPKNERTEGETLSDTIVSDVELAQGWLSLCPDRKATKRQVMTLPYGSTLYSCREYTEAWLKTKLESEQEPWPSAARFAATQFMSKLIWESIGEVVIAAREAMAWLQSCAKVVASEQLPIYWTTPSGFRVMQSYKNTSARRVKTKLGDAVVKLHLSQEEDSLDKRRMQSAVSPNFVHSMDATHLSMSVCYGHDNGIESFAMIHDSFGTHAANTHLFSACIREAFVDLYTDIDVLSDFREQIIRQVSPENAEEIPPLPAKGDLDLQAVRDSDFAFA